MTLEAETGCPFVGHELEVRGLLERQERLEKDQGFWGPVRPMVAAGKFGDEGGVFLEEAGAEPVKMGATDLEVVGAIIGIHRASIELLEDLLEKQIGEAFGELLFLIAPSQTNRCPLVEGFRRPSLRSGLLKPSTKGPITQPHRLSPFELAAVSFCSRPDSRSTASVV